MDELDERIARLRTKEREVAEERELLEQALASRPVTPLLLKPADAAAYLGVGRQHMYRLLRPGPYSQAPEIPSIQVGARRLLVPREACDQWVKTQIDVGRSDPRAVKRA